MLQSDGQDLLARMRRALRELDEEGERIYDSLSTRKTWVETERSQVQSELERLRPLVEAGRGTQFDESEYVLLLHRRKNLDKEYKEAIESAAQLALPEDKVKIWTTVTLDGTAAEVAE